MHPSYGAAGGSASGPAPLKKGRRIKQTLSGWEVRTCTICWIIFTLVVCNLAFGLPARGGFPTLAWVLLVLTITMSIVILLLGVSTGRGEHVATGLLCMASVALAVPIGYYVGREIMREYYHLKHGAEYSGVLPSQMGSAHSDAVQINFVQNALVDTFRTIGWKSGGDTWCVAPVIIEGQYTTAVEYWAVGKNCCQSKGGFACDDVNDETARKAYIPLEFSDITSDAKDRDKSPYLEAIDQAEEIWGLQSQPGALLVRWKKDPDALESELGSTALAIVLVATSFYLMGTVGTSVAFRQFAPKRY